jgi:hypothetical protein
METDFSDFRRSQSQEEIWRVVQLIRDDAKMCGEEDKPEASWSVLAEINYPATPPSYNFNNIGKYVSFFAYYPYYDGFRAIIWKNIWVIPIIIRVI